MAGDPSGMALASITPSSANLHTGVFEMGFRKLTTANRRGTRLEKLKTLADKLAECIDLAQADSGDIKQLAPLAKQYRDTIKEIEEIEGTNDETDEIGAILTERASDGKPGAVRKDRS